MEANELENKVRGFKEKSFSKAAKQLKEKEKLLDYCIKKAWADAMQRERFKGFKDSKILQNSEVIKKRLKDEIKTKNYAAGFDAWHKKMCENTDYNMRVGVWQKFINMTFKYLYCVREYFDEIGDFSFCHCPIDSWIAAKMIKNKLITSNDNGYDLVYSIANSGKTNWNNIEYGDYMQFENVVENVLKNKESRMSKVAFDFIYWENPKA